MVELNKCVSGIIWYGGMSEQGLDSLIQETPSRLPSLLQPSLSPKCALPHLAPAPLPFPPGFSYSHVLPSACSNCIFSLSFHFVSFCFSHSHCSTSKQYPLNLLHSHVPLVWVVAHACVLHVGCYCFSPGYNLSRLWGQIDLIKWSVYM